MTQAILRFRQGGFIITPTDYDDEEERLLLCGANANIIRRLVMAD